jgi:hypothetical protein
MVASGSARSLTGTCRPVFAGSLPKSTFTRGRRRPVRQSAERSPTVSPSAAPRPLSLTTAPVSAGRTIHAARMHRESTRAFFCFRARLGRLALNGGHIGDTSLRRPRPVLIRRPDISCHWPDPRCARRAPDMRRHIGHHGVSDRAATIRSADERKSTRVWAYQFHGRLYAARVERDSIALPAPQDSPVHGGLALQSTRVHAPRPFPPRESRWTTITGRLTLTLYAAEDFGARSRVHLAKTVMIVNK